MIDLKQSKLLDIQNKMVWWAEPRPGKNAKGEDITANVLLCAPVKECIAMQRVSRGNRDEMELLQDFIAIHWAWFDKP